MAWRVDLLGRSLRDMVNTAYDLQQQGTKAHLLTEKLDIETSTGRMMLTILGAMAEYLLDPSGESTMVGLQAALASGRRAGEPRKLSKTDLEAGRPCWPSASSRGPKWPVGS